MLLFINSLDKNLLQYGVSIILIFSLAIFWVLLSASPAIG